MSKAKPSLQEAAMNLKYYIMVRKEPLKPKALVEIVFPENNTFNHKQLVNLIDDLAQIEEKLRKEL